MERGFLIFLISFSFFFKNFLARVEYERNSGLNFFSLFLGLSHLVSALNNARKRFFNFLNFFGNFLARVEYERNSGLKFFFFSFSAYLVLFCLKIMLEWGFWILWIFLQFFLEVSCSGWVRTEFGTKFFFFFSFSAYLIPFWLKIMLESGFLIFFFNFFAIFFGIFFPRPEIGTKIFFFPLLQPIYARFGSK